MSDDEAWSLIDSLCSQTSRQTLFLSDEMASKYELTPYVKKLLPSWVRRPELSGWESNERNPWSIIHGNRPLA